MGTLKDLEQELAKAPAARAHGPADTPMPAAPLPTHGAGKRLVIPFPHEMQPGPKLPQPPAPLPERPPTVQAASDLLASGALDFLPEAMEESAAEPAARPGAATGGESRHPEPVRSPDPWPLRDGAGAGSLLPAAPLLESPLPAFPPPPGVPRLEPMAITPEDVMAAADPFCYVSGRAGTGKTTLARMLDEQREDTVLCATTGIAAVNLGNASTLNSLLHYFDTASLQRHHASRYLLFRLQKLRAAGLRTILLDEVSMLPAEQLTCLVEAIEELNSVTDYDRQIWQFGDEDDLRMRLILVGDFGQLPPVEAPFAFESPVWDRFAGKVLKLEKVWRQEHQAFAHALHMVRMGKPAEALEVLAPQFVNAIDPNFPGTTIVAKNVTVDQINAMRHSKLEGEPLVWKSVWSGEALPDWKKEIPAAVALKPGALVMCLMNRPRPSLAEVSRDYYYVNGDLGTVVELDTIQTADGPAHQGIKVQLQRTGEVVTVVPHTKENTEPLDPPQEVGDAYIAQPGEVVQRVQKDGRLVKVITKRMKGAVTYMPLRLAYATTVHKSQGLSLDRVQVVLADWMFTKPGMTYVALSRCRTLEGLRIVGTAKSFMGKCGVDKKVARFL